MVCVCCCCSVVVVALGWGHWKQSKFNSHAIICHCVFLYHKSPLFPNSFQIFKTTYFSHVKATSRTSKDRMLPHNGGSMMWCLSFFIIIWENRFSDTIFNAFIYSFPEEKNNFILGITLKLLLLWVNKVRESCSWFDLNWFGNALQYQVGARYKLAPNVNIDFSFTISRNLSNY